MSVDEMEKPYQLGMTLLCTGSIINWIARDYYNRPSVQYIAQTCVIVGVLCMCLTVYKWYKATLKDYPNIDPSSTRVLESSESSLITINTASWDSMPQKPPDYLMVEDPPPNYDEAIKLQIQNCNEITENFARNKPVPVHKRLKATCQTPPPPPPYSLEIE